MPPESNQLNGRITTPVPLKCSKKRQAARWRPQKSEHRISVTSRVVSDVRIVIVEQKFVPTEEQ